MLNDTEIIANNKPAPQMVREDNEMDKRKHEFEPIIFNSHSEFFFKYMQPKLDTDDDIAIEKIQLHGLECSSDTFNEIIELIN